MDGVTKVVMSVLAFLFVLVFGLTWYALSAPDDPNIKICPVVGNVAVCEEK